MVEEVAPVREGVGARDRETEPAPRRRAATGELVEELAAEVLRDARPLVHDRDPQVAVDPPDGDDDRRRSVAERVDDEVRDDAVEDDRIDHRLQLVVDLEREVAPVGVEFENAVEPVGDPNRLRVDLDRMGLEAGEVEQPCSISFASRLLWS